MTESELIRHEACPHCGSSDANALYTDGHHFCFSCQTYTPAEGEVTHEPQHAQSTQFIKPEVTPLTKRGLNYETCRQYGYGVAEYLGSPVQVASFTDIQGRVVAQKLRYPDKTEQTSHQLTQIIEEWVWLKWLIQ